MLGSWRQRAASPRRAVAACCRATGKERPSASPWRSTSCQAGEARQSAAACKGGSAPASLPKLKVSTTPVAVSRPTPPRAKGSAEDTAQGVGSSSTKSTPCRRARAARVHLSAKAASPRWTQLPLMAQTTAQSAPKAWRTAWMWCRWPLWKGLYSAMMPIVRMAQPPLGKILKFGEKTVVLSRKMG